MTPHIPCQKHPYFSQPGENFFATSKILSSFAHHISLSRSSLPVVKIVSGYIAGVRRKPRVLAQALKARQLAMAAALLDRFCPELTVKHPSITGPTFARPLSR